MFNGRYVRTNTLDGDGGVSIGKLESRNGNPLFVYSFILKKKKQPHRQNFKNFKKKKYI